MARCARRRDYGHPRHQQARRDRGHAPRTYAGRQSRRMVGHSRPHGSRPPDQLKLPGTPTGGTHFLPRLAALAALLLAVLLVACDTSPVPPPQPTANVTLSPTVPPPAPSPTSSPSLSGDISQTFDVDGHK